MAAWKHVTEAALLQLQTPKRLLSVHTEKVSIRLYVPAFLLVVLNTDIHIRSKRPKYYDSISNLFWSQQSFSQTEPELTKLFKKQKHHICPVVVDI